MHRRGFLAALTACCCAPFVRQPPPPPDEVPITLTSIDDHWTQFKPLSARHAALPRVTQHELQAVRPGLYVVQDPNESYVVERGLFVIGEDRCERVCLCILLARVRAKASSDGVTCYDESFVRADGCQVLALWAPA